MHNRIRRGGFAAGLLAVVLAAAAGCTNPGGHFSVLGYTTEPNYDPGICTVYVPIAQNITFRRGLEFDLTRAVIREIGSKTPFRIVDCKEKADTELCLKVVTWRKNV